MGAPGKSVAAGSARTVREDMRAQFARVAATCELPPLPAVAVRAMQLVRNPETTAEAIAKLVSTDVALAARVLRIAGSALYARRIPPSTLIEAITTVGFETLKRMLVAASARSVFAGRDETAERLWAHALITALAADELAVRDGERRGGASFLAGLLHDVGRLLFHVANRQAYAALGPEDDAREVQVFGVPHAPVAACLAEQWGLTDEVVTAIMLHHEPGIDLLADRLARADRLAHQLGYGSTPAPFEGAEDPDLAELGSMVLEAFDRERGLFV
jgi:HD-like signal output (HDOD) protein